MTWWSTTFDHFNKTQMFSRTERIRVSDTYQLVLLNTPPYQRNISLARVRNHHLLAREFHRLAVCEEAPDVILASLPPLDFAESAVRLGNRAGVPTVVDIRDLWPDLFLDLVPPPCRPVGRLALTPYYRLARSACSHADAITSNTEAFLQWGLKKGNRQQGPQDKVFPFGYRPPLLEDSARLQASRFWDDLGIGTDPDCHVVCFFGSINHQFDFETMLDGFQQVSKHRRIQLVVCGRGESLDSYRERTKYLRDVFFPGWIGADKIWTLMQRSSCGIAPYIDTTNFRGNLANKPIEYLAGGLPILSSLDDGVLAHLLRETQCGASYGGDPSRLAQLLSEWCSNPHQLQTMQQHAAALFQRRFAADIVYQDMARHLEALAEMPGSSYYPRRAA